ncbi:MAG: hypothetical protein HOK41_17180 [Nitrospina sp.]|nr:hypothetical protein [Nitrospina sp.]
MPSLILANVNLFHETMGISHLLFYGSSLAIMGLFSTRHGTDLMRWKHGLVLAGILLANQISLSWAVYPMNKELPIWTQHLKKDGGIAEIFSPTDRIMRVSPPMCGKSYRTKIGFINDADPDNYHDCVKNKFIDQTFGAYRHIPGYMFTPPVFELSAGTSHTQYEVSEFKKALIKTEFPEQKFPMGFNRTLQRDPPVFSSKLYDITGVKYLFSSSLLVETDRIKLAYSSRQFYLYRYLDSWPYFYLADQIETISNYEDLYEAEKGVAYLWEGGPDISIPSKISDSTKNITLSLFEFDQMEFDYKNNQSEFLVISDAWHPNWRAKINGVDADIIKTNGVFKGILLPAGKGKVMLYFDNSSYRHGIWISLAGWVLFISSWIIFSRKSWKLTNQDSLNPAN